MQQVAHARKSGFLDLIGADDRKWLRGLRDALQDARAGDDDLLHLLRLCGLRRRCLLGERRGRRGARRNRPLHRQHDLI